MIASSRIYEKIIAFLHLDKEFTKKCFIVFVIIFNEIDFHNELIAFHKNQIKKKNFNLKN